MVPESPTAKTSVPELPHTPLSQTEVPLVIEDHPADNTAAGISKKMISIICVIFLCLISSPLDKLLCELNKKNGFQRNKVLELSLLQL
jgi:hypothetical protein